MSIRAYHVTDTGDTVEIDMKSSQLDNFDAVLVLDDDQGDLWVLRDQLNVKKKFLVARTAANMNLSEGLRFRIRHVEPDERTQVLQKFSIDAQIDTKRVINNTSSKLETKQYIQESVPKKLHNSVKVPDSALSVDISAFFENFTRIALVERAIPKESLPPREDLEVRLNTYLKNFLDTLYA